MEPRYIHFYTVSDKKGALNSWQFVENQFQAVRRVEALGGYLVEVANLQVEV